MKSFATLLSPAAVAQQLRSTLQFKQDPASTESKDVAAHFATESRDVEAHFETENKDVGAHFATIQILCKSFMLKEKDIQVYFS